MKLELPELLKPGTETAAPLFHPLVILSDRRIAHTPVILSDRVREGVEESPAGTPSPRPPPSPQETEPPPHPRGTLRLRDLGGRSAQGDKRGAAEKTRDLVAVPFIATVTFNNHGENPRPPLVILSDRVREGVEESPLLSF